MGINVNRYSNKHSFEVVGASYIGAPKDNTAMFISKKIGDRIQALEAVNHCLVFAETGITVSDTIQSKHCIVFSDNPQFDYALFSKELFDSMQEIESKTHYNVIENGSLINDTATIGHNSYIEPNVLIGPGVVIGDNCTILSGSIIKNSTIGNNVIVNERAMVGVNGFTMADDKYGNKIRIYSLGKVIVGDNVEIGAGDNISRGSAGDTLIDDNVKIDALVHIGHDVHLHKNVEITAGVVVGGFVEAKEYAYIGINAVIRNRIQLGKHSLVGMGATVTKSVDDGITVVGNPAKPFIK